MTNSGERAPGNLSTELGKTTEECCCGYNMLKLARHVYGWTADPRVMDYYERTLFNSRLGTQNLEDGGMSYFLPLGSGYWKYFNSPYDSFWCCTGTGVEEFAKTADTIYFHDDHGIFVNLFIASEVDWPEKGLRLEQQTNFPEEEGTALVFHAERPVDMALNIRIPWWATNGGTIKLNGTALPAFSSPGSYLTLKRTWKEGDRVEVRLPMSLRIETLPGDDYTAGRDVWPAGSGGTAGPRRLDEADVLPGIRNRSARRRDSCSRYRDELQGPAGLAETRSRPTVDFPNRGTGKANQFDPAL